MQAGLACLICSLCGFQSDNHMKMTGLWLIPKGSLFWQVDWDTAALRGARQAPVSCLACCWSQMWSEMAPVRCPSGKDEQTCIPVLQRWWDEPSALMSHGRLWQLSPESQMDPWLFSVQALGMPSDVGVLWLDFDLSLCTEPCCLPSHCLQHPGQTSCLRLFPFPGELWEKNSLT